MRYFIRILESSRVKGSRTEMIHKDEQGRLFLGPRISNANGLIVVVEASDSPLEDGYYHIIKVVGKA